MVGKFAFLDKSQNKKRVTIGLNDDLTWFSDDPKWYDWVKDLRVVFPGGVRDVFELARVFGVPKNRVVVPGAPAESIGSGKE